MESIIFVYCRVCNGNLGDPFGAVRCSVWQWVKDWLDEWVLNIRFVYDGWFGIDKIGHFSLHAGLTWLGVILGAPAWPIFLYDTIIDLQTEYRQDRQGIGFSPLDVLYGRLGCGVVLWIYGLWQPWIVRMLQ